MDSLTVQWSNDTDSQTMFRKQGANLNILKLLMESGFKNNYSYSPVHMLSFLSTGTVSVLMKNSGNNVAFLYFTF